MKFELALFDEFLLTFSSYFMPYIYRLTLRPGNGGCVLTPISLESIPEFLVTKN